MRIVKINNSYYCNAAKNYSFPEFISKIKKRINAAENTFAYNYSLKIYSQLFRYADDLLQIYNNYYVSEYDSFKTYLYQKELLDKIDISSIYIDDNHTILKLNYEFNNYNIDTLFYDEEENNLELINKALEDIFVWS